MAFTKIQNSDLVGVGVIGLPDTPGLSTAAMQSKFEETSRSVVIPKHNGLIDELEATSGAASLGMVAPTGRTGNTVQTVMDDVSSDLGTAESKIVTLEGEAHTHANKALLDTYNQTNADLTDAVSKKHDHSNKALLDTYTQTESNLADAVSKKHDHSNKSLLDSYNQSNSDISDAVSKRHSHSNKSLLDTYTQTEVNLADAVSKKHSHSNKSLLDTYTQTEANLADAVSKKHSHANKSTLDKFGESGGKPTFNGNQIGVQDAYKNVKVGLDTITASGEDTLELEAGANISLSVSGKKVNIKSTGSIVSAVWGGLTGDIDDQTDLKDALDAKTDASDITATETDTDPYTLRQSLGNLADMEIEGASVAWNQLVEHGNFDATTGWNRAVGSSTLAVSNNVCSLTIGEVKNYQSIYRTGVTNDRENHVIFGCATIKAPKAVSVDLYTAEKHFGQNTLTANTKTTISGITKIGNSVSNANFYIDLDLTSALAVGDVVTVENVMYIDLTALFGTTIADAIYTMEQSVAGSGVAFFRKYFPNDYYAYDAGTIQSVCVGSRKVYDSGNNLVATYAFDSSKQLRGLFTIENGKLKANGDIYSPSGSISRNYNIVELNGSESWSAPGSNGFAISKANAGITDVLMAGTKQTPIISNLFPYSSNINVWTDGYIGIDNGTIWIGDTNYSRFTDLATFKTYLSNHHLWIVYPLATPTTESALSYQNPQRAYSDGTEEFTDGLTRDVMIPVGNTTTYQKNVTLPPIEDYADGAAEMAVAPLKCNESTAGDYTLKATVDASGNVTYSWEAVTP